METSELEELLRRQFSQEVNDVSADGGTATRVAVAGQRAMAKRRKARGGIALTAVVVASTVAFLAPNAVHTLTRESTHGVASGSDQQTPMGWALALRRGPDTSAAYGTDGHLTIGSKSYDLPGTSSGTAGPVAGGWLVSYLGGNGPHYAIMSSDGELRTLPDYTGNLDVRGTLISPDGREAVINGSLVDLETEEEVGIFPEPGILDSWTDGGIIYSSASRVHKIWQPGSEPQRLDPDPFGDLGEDGHNFTQSGVAATSEEGCTRLWQAHGDGSVTQPMDECQTEWLLLSRDGSKALMADGSLIDVPSGEAAGRLAVPQDWQDLFAGTLDNHVRFVWDGTSALLLTVTGPEDVTDGNVGRWPTVIVRCPISGESCARVSDTFNDPSGYLPVIPAR